MTNGKEEQKAPPSGLQNSIYGTQQASNIIVLRNLASPQEVADTELEGEVLEECSRFGSVTRIVMHVNDAQTQLGIYVAFALITHATAAITSLNKRFFAGRLVSAEYYNAEKFQAGQFET